MNKIKKQHELTTHVDETTQAKNDPKNYLTKLRRDEVDKEEERQNREEILAAGQEDVKKGMAEVKRQTDEENKQKEATAERFIEELDSKRQFDESYRGTMARALAQILGTLDWIKGWTADVVATNGSPITIKGQSFTTRKGILLVVCAPNGRVFHKGMLMTKEPALDYAGLYQLALQMENTLDKERGLLLDGSQKPKEPALVDQYGRAINQQRAVDTTDGTAV